MTPAALRNDVALLRSPWTDAFSQLISAVDNDLILASPFVKTSVTARVLKELRRRGAQDRVHVMTVTNLRPESAINSSLDLEALVTLGKALPRFDLVHLPSLHAKVYIADTKMAIVTSANLTEPGLSGNLEYGAVFRRRAVVEQVREDLESYALLGARISPEDVDELASEITRLRILFKEAERSVRAEARNAFRAKLEEAEVRILRHRVKGRTTQSIFCDTILFLLGKRPFATVELHPLIQRMHPDLCDDSIDRVIDGEHFGKRWKHLVRSAQQYLKRHGLIHYSGGQWFVSSGS